MKKMIRPLIEKGLIARTNPSSPHAPNQKYITVKRSRDD